MRYFHIVAHEHLPGPVVFLGEAPAGGVTAVVSCRITDTILAACTDLTRREHEPLAPSFKLEIYIADWHKKIKDVQTWLNLKSAKYKVKLSITSSSNILLSKF